MPANGRPPGIAALKEEIQACLHEDPINLEWTLEKVDRLSWSLGRGLYSSLLLLLANLTFDHEDDARRQWEAILKHRLTLEKAVARPVGLRVAALDLLIETNRRTSRPRLLELLQTTRPLDKEMTDPVTGLKTRSFLNDQIPREVERARRYELDLSVVHLELDDFPRLTEDLGHTIGTVLLREMATVISGCIRTIDYAARMSGGQFALLLTETDRMGAYYVADRIRQKVEEFYLERQIDGRPFELTASAGVASFPRDGSSAQELARKAGDAYFTARARGRGRVAIHHPERREYIRLEMDNKDLQVTLVPEGAEPSASGAMRNISSGGVLYESERPVEMGRTVHVLCRNRRAADQVLIPGRVVRIEKFETDAGERYEIGVLFDLVVEEQLEGVIEFLERFTAGGDDPPAAAP